MGNHGSKSGFLDLVVLSWIIITTDNFSKNEKLNINSWSNISTIEQHLIGDILKNKINHVFREPTFTENFFKTLF